MSIQPRPDLRSLAARHRLLQWAALLALSAIFVPVLDALHLPAALLLGPMAAAIVLSAANGAIRIHRWPFYLAQGVLGCMIARSITPPILVELVRDWPLILAVIAAVIAVSSGIGLLLARWQVLPGSAAIWGSFPGAASAMVLMADAYGADVRLVAFMQYLRVALVAITASLVARIWAIETAVVAPAVVWFPPMSPAPFLATLAVAFGGAVVAGLLKIPAGPLVVPLVLATGLQGSGVMTLELPPWLLALTYALIGWSIGLRFSRAILRHVATVLPRVALSIFVLIAACGGIAALLVAGFGVDPLTAYLATSPGGLDAVAIIAASSTVDLPFVMAMQTGRFLVVLVTGPVLARFISTRWFSPPPDD